MPRRIDILLLAMLSAAALAGCCGPSGQKACPAVIRHYLAPPEELIKVGSVAFVELSCDSGLERVSGELDDALYVQLQQKNLFNIIPISRGDRRCQDLPLNQADAFDFKQLAAMRKALGCDSILLGRIYRFEPYPRMKVSVQLRLMDLKRGRLIWSVDHTWDTTDKDLEPRIKEFFEDEVRNGFGPVNEGLVLMSPRMFTKFVAFEAAGTMPCRRQLEHPVPTTNEAMKESAGQAGKKVKKAAESIQEEM